MASSLVSFYKEYETVDEKYKKPRTSTMTITPVLSPITEVEKYKRLEQIGNKGKEGVTFSVKRIKDNKEFAMKTFKKMKSEKNIANEGRCQNLASKMNICPKVIDVNLEKKFIVMDKLDYHLYELMKKQNGNLTKLQQEQIYYIFQKLDEANVFHGDSNILNYMYKGDKLYIIDFGMSKVIDDKLKKKLQTDTPNATLMTLGFILKLKELKCPESSYSHLLKHISKENKDKYGLVPVKHTSTLNSK